MLCHLVEGEEAEQGVGGEEPHLGLVLEAVGRRAYRDQRSEGLTY